MDIKEFEIPVPWGQIAAKTWGSEKNTPVLLVHGAYDNIGSFECLIPYLKEDFYYICIDLPGHGHSWGGHVAITFTHLYPERVLKLILLDVIFAYPLSVDYFKQYLRDRIDYLSKMNKKRLRNLHHHTYNEAFSKIQKNRMYGEITNEAAKALVKRALTPLENGEFQFSTKFPIEAFFNTLFGKEFITELIKQYPVMCPVLFIIANHSAPAIQYYKSFLKELWKHNNQCFVRRVDGTHDVHMNDPKIVASIINGFLIYKGNKL